MSQPRFTPITSSLLARKGDAVPSAASPKPSLFWAQGEVPPFAPEQPQPDAGQAPSVAVAKPRRMMVTLSAPEFEKLGIAAVKKGVTRHQLMRAALDLYLERLKCEFSECDCMTGGGLRREGCAQG